MGIVKSERVLGHLRGETGPTLVCVGGIHGNEPSGVTALKEVIEELTGKEKELRGSVIALIGNTKALALGKRYIDQDLNRIWNQHRIDQIKKGTFTPSNAEEAEQVELFQVLDEVLTKCHSPIYFIDLHTTSSETKPFLTVNDSLANRRFSSEFPLPTILGIEEYLDGPLLSYINELGYVAVGFEGGSHQDPNAVVHHKAFVYLSLMLSGILQKQDSGFEQYWRILAQKDDELNAPFEIIYRQWVNDSDEFKMVQGFVNFQRIKKGELLAYLNGMEIKSPYNARVFMPLYQSQGNDGFFLIRKIPKFFLALSAVLRKWRVDKLLPILPGITRVNGSVNTLQVDKRIARFMTKPILHLLGFRYRENSGRYVIIKNREMPSDSLTK